MFFHVDIITILNLIGYTLSFPSETKSWNISNLACKVEFQAPVPQIIVLSALFLDTFSHASNYVTEDLENMELYR